MEELGEVAVPNFLTTNSMEKSVGTVIRSCVEVTMNFIKNGVRGSRIFPLRDSVSFKWPVSGLSSSQESG